MYIDIRYRDLSDVMHPEYKEHYKKHLEKERVEAVKFSINYIIENYQPTNAKEFEILGRAIKGCELITIMYDGTLYYPGKLKNTSADWEAMRLINNAIKELGL